jgi:Cys-tRNA(Pro) deacylase
LNEHHPDAPPHLLEFLSRHQIRAEFIAPGVPTPTVASAAAAIGVTEEQILKTLLFAGEGERYVVAIASGTRRVSRERLEAISGIRRLRAANPHVVLAVTGYAAGGVAPIGLNGDVPVVVDSTVAALPVAFGGGGREHLLLRIDPADIIRLNEARVSPIVEGD